MKKFDLRKIMTRAWGIVKASAKKMSEALKQAWAEAKNTKTIFSGKEMFEGFQFVLWEKYGKHRVYITNYSGSNKGNSKGYIDVDNFNNIVATGCVKSMAQYFLTKFEIVCTDESELA